MAKVTKYEAFLNEKLRPDLKACLEDRDNIYAEIAEYASLKKSIEFLTQFPMRLFIILGLFSQPPNLRFHCYLQCFRGVQHFWQGLKTY